MSFQNCKVVSKNTDAEKYHADKNSVKRGDPKFAMSPSALKEFFRCGSRWVRGYQSPESKSKQFGSAVDALLLTPDSFGEKYAIKPETYKDAKTGEIKPFNANSNVCKAWIEEHSGLEVISKSELTEFKTAAARLRGDEVISSFLDAGDKQVLVRGEWKDKKTGLVIPVECLIDIFPRADTEFDGTIGDMKCVKNAMMQPFQRQVFQYGWHVQGAFDLDMAHAATGRDLNNWVFIGVENYEPFEPFRRLLGENFLMIGRQAYAHALGLYCQALKTGKWNSYDDLPSNHPLAIGDWTLCEADPWMEFSALEDKLESDYNEAAEAVEESSDVPMP